MYLVRETRHSAILCIFKSLGLRQLKKKKGCSQAAKLPRRVEKERVVRSCQRSSVELLGVAAE